VTPVYWRPVWPADQVYQAVHCAKYFTVQRIMENSSIF